MMKMEGALLDFAYLDLIATRETAVHRLDPRAKVLATLVYVVAVVSYGRYEVSALIPFIIFPAVMVSLGGLPVGFLVRKVLVVLPFALLVGLANPLIDRAPLVELGPVVLSAGWVSFASIVLRSILTVGAALVLVAVTGFTGVCMALERLGMPRVFAVQLLFLYRYIFVLTDEAARTARARELRSFGRRGMGLRPFAALVGNLFLRTWDRAERVYRAMLSRGFRGEFHVRRSHRFGPAELLFTAGWSAVFILFRLVNVPLLLGNLVTGVLL